MLKLDTLILVLQIAFSLNRAALRRHVSYSTATQKTGDSSIISSHISPPAKFLLIFTCFVCPKMHEKFELSSIECEINSKIEV